MIAPILKYPGSKWRLADWIVQHMPPHQHYIEPFFGSGAVFFTKYPSPHEVINDLDHQVVNLFRVIRTQGEALAAAIEMTPWSRAEFELSYQDVDAEFERARRFLVRCWQMNGTRTNGHRSGWRNRGKAESSTVSLWQRLPAELLKVARRLKDAEIECRPAVEVIRRYNAANCLIYADPPYVLSSRTGGKAYRHEMPDDEHLALLDALDEHPGPVLLSGYTTSLYEERLPHWYRIQTTTQAEKGLERTEVLWLNEAAAPLRMF